MIDTDSCYLSFSSTDFESLVCPEKREEYERVKGRFLAVEEGRQREPGLFKVHITLVALSPTAKELMVSVYHFAGGVFRRRRLRRTVQQNLYHFRYHCGAGAARTGSHRGNERAQREREAESPTATGGREAVVHETGDERLESCKLMGLLTDLCTVDVQHA